MFDSTEGRLTKAHALKHSDYTRLMNAAEEFRDTNLGYAQGLERSAASIVKESTINVLA